MSSYQYYWVNKIPLWRLNNLTSLLYPQWGFLYWRQNLYIVGELHCSWPKYSYNASYPAVPLFTGLILSFCPANERRLSLAGRKPRISHGLCPMFAICFVFLSWQFGIKLFWFEFEIKIYTFPHSLPLVVFLCNKLSVLCTGLQSGSSSVTPSARNLAWRLMMMESSGKLTVSKLVYRQL